MKKRLSLVFVFVVMGLNVGLSGEGMEITGQVKDDQMRLVEGADIAIYGLYGDDYYSPRSAKLLDEFKKTDSKGQFAFSVSIEPNHDIYVVAGKEGLALGWAYVHKTHIFQAKPTNDPLTVVLERPYKLTGKLVDFQGEAVAGAFVQVFKREYDIVCEPRDWFSVKTDTLGQFEFDNLPIELMAKFYVHVPQRDVVYVYPPHELTGNAAGGYHVDWDDIELRLPLGATVQGHLINQDTNQGMANVDIMLCTGKQRDTNWRFRSCKITSGAQGRFVITGVPPGTHNLRLVSPKTDQSVYVGKNVPITVNPLDKTLRTNMFIKKGVPFQVMVRAEATGQALSGVKVFVDDRWERDQKDVFVHETRTDANGVAHLWVPQGHFKLFAHGDNWDDGTKFEGTEVVISGPRPAPVTILVKPTVPLVRGTVVDTQGQPQENVTIQVGIGQAVLTDENGWFEGIQNPGYPSHMVTARDARNNLAGGNFFYDPRQKQRIVLKRGASMQGRVTDEQGRGVPGARVSLGLACRKSGGRDGVYGTAAMASARADSEGYYCIDTVAPPKPGYYYRMRFTAPEFSDTGRTVKDRIKPGEDFTLPDMKLAKLDAFVTGVVVDAKDRPAPFKPVFIGKAMGASTGSATTTDEQGRFKVNRIPEGPVAVQVGFSLEGPDTAAYVHAHTGDHVKIRLGEHFKDYVPPDSLVGQPLPDLSSLEIGFDPRRVKNKKTLMCFVDYTRHASQSAINYLNKVRYDIQKRNIIVFCVQVTPVDEEAFKAWKKTNKIRMPIAVLSGDTWWNDKQNPSVLHRPKESMGVLADKWGVRSLPWVILTDENQNVMATGFEPHRVLHLVPDPNPSIRLRNNR